MNEKPRIVLLTNGPARGMWRCQSQHWSHHHGACFGKTPADAYKKWESWQEHVKARPFAFLGVAA